MAFVNKVNGIPIDDFLAVNPAYMKTPAIDKYGNPYLFEDGTPQYTIEIRSEYIGDNPLYDINTGKPFVKKETEQDQMAIEEANRRENLLGKTFPGGYFDPATYEVPTVDPFSGQQVSTQDQEAIENIKKRLDYLKSLDPNYLVPGSAGGMVLEDAIARQQETLNDILNKYTNQSNIPTVDPFSGQQVSAQEQAAFTQPQAEIFPQQELPTVQPEAPFQPYQAEPSNVGIFVGPSYDKYSQARIDAYANAPSKFDYDVTANQAAGQFIQDRAREIYGDNIFGKGIGTLGAVAGVPLAMFSSPFHEAAQVVMEGRMKPGSGIEGFYKAFMNELPFETARNRALGVMKSIPGVGEPIYQGLTNLTSRDPVLSSLTKNFNNLTLQEMDKIRNTSREKLIEQARSAGQEGGMGYLLGF